MNKEVFINELRMKLSGLPQNEIEERIIFYTEMIDDRVEDGMSEEEAVAAVGSVDDIASQIMSEIPLSKLVKDRVKPKKKMEAWKIVLLIVTSPIWFSILVTVLSVIFSLYITIWSLIFSVYITDLAFAAVAVAGIPLGIILGVTGNIFSMLFMFACALVSAGVAILLFFASVGLTKGFVELTRKMLTGFKRLIVGREEVSDEHN